MTSRRRFLAAIPGTLLAVPAAAQRLSGAVRELSGEVTLDDRPVSRETARGMRRQLVTPSATIGIRGTGVYLEATAALTYACTCFGTTEIGATTVTARSHSARRIARDGRIVEAPFERHTNEEMTRLERLAGRPNPFSS